jgi:hypothetical protein
MNHGTFSHPQKTAMTLNIGVTGHRFLPDAQPSALSSQIGRALDELRLITERLFEETRDFYAGEAPHLRVISMLAEGSDQLVAEAGIARGYCLQCVIPMDRDAYLDTIASDSAKVRLQELSAAADAVYEIGCASGVAPRAYLNGGQVMLGHSDVLIAIWDGEDSGKIGGTSNMVSLALQQNIPVLRIDAKAPHGISLLHRGPEDPLWEAGLQGALRESLTLGKGNGGLFPAAYFCEITGRKSHMRLYQRLVGHFTRKPARSPAPDVEPDENPFFTARYGSYYQSANSLAMYYRDIYRSVGILRQLLPFLASIGLAVGFYATLLIGPVAISTQSAPVLNGISVFGFAVQAICFLLIIVLSRLEKKNRWHQKFLDYRMLAEMLRQMKYLGPSGLVIRGLNISAYSSDVNVSWVNWYFRAIVREAGFPALSLSEADLARWADTTVGAILRGQIEYHRSNASVMQRIASRLERFGLRVYYIGIGIMILRAAVFYFATADTHTTLNEVQKSYLTKVFNMLSMVAPLFSSLAFGLSAQEGFASLQHRSEDMLLRLSNMEKQMSRQKSEDFNAFMALTQALTNLMLSEFTDWNMFIRTKSISDH